MLDLLLSPAQEILQANVSGTSRLATLLDKKEKKLIWLLSRGNVNDALKMPIIANGTRQKHK